MIIMNIEITTLQNSESFCVLFISKTASSSGLIKNIAENNVGLRFVTVEGYASAYGFYINHNFINMKKDDDKIKEKLDIITERNPEQTFYLYLDLRVLE